MTQTFSSAQNLYKEHKLLPSKSLAAKENEKKCLLKTKTMHKHAPPQKKDRRQRVLKDRAGDGYRVSRSQDKMEY